MTSETPVVPFDPRSWSSDARAALTAAGALHVSSARPASVQLEWPVGPTPDRSAVEEDDDDVVRSIPIEVQQQDGGSLLVLALFSWQLSVTPANKLLIELVSDALCRKHRADDGFIDVNWQYNSDDQRDAPFSLDDYVRADTPDWLERVLASVRRFEQIFAVLDPFVRAAAGGQFPAGSAHVALHALGDRLAGVHLPADIAAVRAVFPAVTMTRFDDGVLRAIKLEASPEAALQALDHPVLAHVDEVSLSFKDDAATRWLDGGRLPRPLKIVEITGLDAETPAVVGALLAPFAECTHLSLYLDDEERFRDVVVTARPAAVPAFTQLEVLDIDCDASAAVERKLLDLLFTHPMPKLRRFTLNSHGKRSGAPSLAPILKRLPDTVTELGLWQGASWSALREKLLASPVLKRLTAVGVRDDVDEMNDPRLADKQLFGPCVDIDDVAHDLHEVGRHRDVVDMIGPVRWKIRDADVHCRYAMSLSELDPEAGVTAWRAVLAIDPRHGAATHNLANQLVWMGRLEEAYPVVVAALALEPDEPWMLRCLAVIWQARGDAQQTEHWVRRLMQAAMAVVVDNDSDDDVDPADRYTLACAQMWVGLPEVALETLAEAVAAGVSGVTPHLDVEWDPLRTDPRWQRLFPDARA